MRSKRESLEEEEGMKEEKKNRGKKGEKEEDKGSSKAVHASLRETVCLDTECTECRAIVTTVATLLRLPSHTFIYNNCTLLNSRT